MLVNQQVALEEEMCVNLQVINQCLASPNIWLTLLLYVDSIVVSAIAIFRLVDNLRSCLQGTPGQSKIVHWPNYKVHMLIISNRDTSSFVDVTFCW